MGTGLAALPFVYIVVIALWTVLVAELVGDKTIYIATSLSVRFQTGIVFMAMVVAFALKMLVVVLLAQAIVQLHSHWTDILSAMAFFASALFIWFKEPEPVPVGRPVSAGWWRAAVVCFASFFFMEWGDPGQIAAGALTVKSHSLLAVWLGGTLAMATRGGLAITVGIQLRDRLPQAKLRALASASCCALGILVLSGLALSR